MAARILLDFDVDSDTVRRAVLSELRGAPARHLVDEDGDAAADGDEIVLEFTEGEDDAFDRAVEIDRGALAQRPVALLVAIVLAAIGFPLGLLFGVPHLGLDVHRA